MEGLKVRARQIENGRKKKLEQDRSIMKIDQKAYKIEKL